MLPWWPWLCVRFFPRPSDFRFLFSTLNCLGRSIRVSLKVMEMKAFDNLLKSAYGHAAFLALQDVRAKFGKCALGGCW